jgi:hypothetical protein
MTVTYLLIAVFAVWSARAIRSAWYDLHGKKLKLSAGDEVCAAAFALSTFYLAIRMVGWS